MRFFIQNMLYRIPRWYLEVYPTKMPRNIKFINALLVRKDSPEYASYLELFFAAINSPSRRQRKPTLLEIGLAATSRGFVTWENARRLHVKARTTQNSRINSVQLSWAEVWKVPLRIVYLLWSSLSATRSGYQLFFQEPCLLSSFHLYHVCGGTQLFPPSFLTYVCSELTIPEFLVRSFVFI